MKAFNYLIVLLLLVSLTYGATTTISSFYGQSNPFNVTFITDSNLNYKINFYTSYLDILNISFSPISNKNYNYTYISGGGSSSEINARDYVYGNLGVYIGYGGVKTHDNITGYLPANNGNYTFRSELYSQAGVYWVNMSLMVFNYTSNAFILLDSYNQYVTGSGTYGDTQYLNSSNPDFINDSKIRYIYSSRMWYKDGTGSSGANYARYVASGTNRDNITLYPRNFSLRLYNETIYTESDILYSDFFVNINATDLNNKQDTGCNGVNCILDNGEIILNFTYHSNSPGIISVNITNGTYSYGIDNCLNSYNISSNATAVNYTFRDEKNNSLVSADIDATFIYDIGGAANTFDLDLTSYTNFSMCIYPNWSSFTVDNNILYSDTPVYPQRAYDLSGDTWSSTIMQKILYLLDTDNGIYVRFKTIDQYENILIGTDIVMKDADTNSTIETQQTDGSGLATFWVDPNNDYIFSFTKTGYETQTKQLRPTTSEIYNVVMPSEGVTVAPSISQGILYKFYPKDSVLSNNTLYHFTFNLTSDYWNITACTLYLKNDTTTLDSSAVTYNSTVCNIDISYNTNNYTLLIAEAVVTVNGTDINYKKIYTVRDTIIGEFSLQNIFDDILAFSDAGFDDKTRILIAFIIIVAITIGVSFKFSFTNPIPGIILFLLLILLFSFAGFMTVDNPSIPTVYGFNLNQYSIFIVMFLGAAGYILWRHNQ